MIWFYLQSAGLELSHQILKAFLFLYAYVIGWVRFVLIPAIYDFNSPFVYALLDYFFLFFSPLNLIDENWE